MHHDQAEFIAKSLGGARKAGEDWSCRCPAHDDDRASLSGAQWSQLQATLDSSVPFTTTLRTCAALSNALKPQLRSLLHYHSGVKTLRTRQMMLDIQSL